MTEVVGWALGLAGAGVVMVGGFTLRTIHLRVMRCEDQAERIATIEAHWVDIRDRLSRIEDLLFRINGGK